ncbi:hypothetical protein LINPERHAP1_LOCUS39975 [Linum perenne]
MVGLSPNSCNQAKQRKKKKVHSQRQHVVLALKYW